MSTVQAQTNEPKWLKLIARLAGNGEGCARVPVAIKFETEKSVEIAT
jgi:hypothetical protein